MEKDESPSFPPCQPYINETSQIVSPWQDILRDHRDKKLGYLCKERPLESASTSSIRACYAEMLRGSERASFRSPTYFGVEGDLTHMLLVGGAYERFRGTVEDARALSRRFMEALFGEELHRVGWAGGSPTPWTLWFYDIAWDGTFVAQEHQRFILLCMTDTD